MDQGAKDFVAGVAAGVALVATGHPFDTVKVQPGARAPLAGPGSWHIGMSACHIKECCYLPLTAHCITRNWRLGVFM